MVRIFTVKIRVYAEYNDQKIFNLHENKSFQRKGLKKTEKVIESFLEGYKVLINILLASPWNSAKTMQPRLF